jgi:LMBR1-like membrane protein
VYRQCVKDNITEVVNNLFLNNTTNSSSKATPTPFLLDMACQKPPGMVPEYVFPNLWRIIYWSSQFLTWLILPLMQSYLKAGEFTFKGKLKSAVIDNAIYYGKEHFQLVSNITKIV